MLLRPAALCCCCCVSLCCASTLPLWQVAATLLLFHYLRSCFLMLIVLCVLRPLPFPSAASDTGSQLSDFPLIMLVAAVAQYDIVSCIFCCCCASWLCASVVSARYVGMSDIVCFAREVCDYLEILMMIWFWLCARVYLFDSDFFCVAIIAIICFHVAFLLFHSFFCLIVERKCSSLLLLVIFWGTIALVTRLPRTVTLYFAISGQPVFW